MTTANLVEIYCIFDDFCKIFEPELKKRMIDMDGKAHRNRTCRATEKKKHATISRHIIEIFIFFSAKHTQYKINT